MKIVKGTFMVLKADNISVNLYIKTKYNEKLIRVLHQLLKEKN